MLEIADSGNRRPRIAWPWSGGARSGALPRQASDQEALIEALDGLASSVSSAGSVDDMLPIIVDSAREFTGADKVAVCLVDEQSDTVTLDAASLVVRGARAEYPQQWWGERLPGIAVRVLSYGRAEIEVDEEQRAWLVVAPVRIAEQPFGVLVVMGPITRPLRREHSAYLSLLGVFAAVAIANARLIEESSTALLASERDRIAREMHDGISQSLFGISLGIELCKKQVMNDPPLVKRRLEEIQAQLGTSMAELRRYVYDLRPLTLRELGLRGAIEGWVHDVTTGRETRGTVRIAGQERHVGSAAEVCIFRIAKEAVSNAVRHAHADAFTVKLEYADESVILTVSDDGLGFDADRALRDALPGGGIGLQSMRERVAACGGTLTIDSGAGLGTVVRAEVPARAAP